MLKKRREHPLLTSLLVLLLYAAAFIMPGYSSEPDPDQHGISGIDGAIALWPSELLLGVAFVIIVTAPGLCMPQCD